MADSSVEEKIFNTLTKDRAPKDLDELIRGVRTSDDAVRAIDVKITALNMVSKGKLMLNERWQLSLR